MFNKSMQILIKIILIWGYSQKNIPNCKNSHEFKEDFFPDPQENQSTDLKTVFKEGKFIGEGGFGVVKYLMIDNKEYAIKK